jgi:CBS domain-containing protein
MNIAFFLIPKQEVAYLYHHFTMRQAIEKMEYHRYTAIPILTKNGKYVGTLTEGDLLWKLKHTPDLDFDKTEEISLKEVPLQRNVKPISVLTDIEGIINLAIDQNFIPVVDDSETFIGIIRRRELIDYMYKKMNSSTVFVKETTIQ